MMKVEHQRWLLRVSTAPKKTLDQLTEGVLLTSTFGQPIEDLIHQAAVDRLKLGAHFLRVATRMSGISRPDWRSVVGRYYYAMYHSMRAVSYYSFHGDDHQEHNKLPGSLPSDFPNRDIRSNELKDARAHRNEADYDPYPSGTAYFRRTARDLSPIAGNFVSECRQYLLLKGCKFL
jgi:hypothetical protein